MKMKPDKLVSIQALRGIAATMIVWWHAVENLVTRDSTYKIAKDCLAIPQDIYQHLAFGVPIFFAISGFIMVVTTWEIFGSKTSAITFLKRRILRIFPTYFIFLLLMQLFLVLHYHFGTGVIPDWRRFFFSFFLLPTIPNYTGYTLGQAWTLTFEMLFYTLFAFSLILHRIWGLTLSVILLLSLPTIFSILNSAANNLFGHCYLSDILLPFITNKHFYYFVIGMIIAIFYKKKMNNVLIYIATIIFIMLQYSNNFQYNTFFACFYILAFTIYFETALARIQLLNKIGDCSYTLYLAHNLIILVCFRIFFIKTGLFEIFNYDLSALLMTLLTLPISYLLYNKFEKRIASYLLAKRTPQ